MSTYNAFFGQITIDADNDDITVDSADVTLTQGDYYMYSPVTAESFLDHLVEVIEDEHGSSVTYSISDDGILTLSAASSVDIEFGSTLYEDLGFTSASQSGTTIIATKKLKYCWFPEMLESESLAPTTSVGKLIPVVSQQQAIDGNAWTTLFGTRTKQELTYEHIEKARAWDVDSDNGSLEEWLAITYYTGRKMVFLPAYDSDTSVKWYYSADLSLGEVDVWRSITGSDSRWGTTLYFIEVDA